MPLEDWFDRLGGLTPIRGNLHRSPLPYTRAHVEQLRKGGIEVVFSMEEAAPGRLIQDLGLEWRPHFWVDDMPPTPDQVGTFLDELREVGTERPVVVHCKAGWGRAGTALVCAMIEREGWSAEKALRHQWSRVPAAEAIMRGNGQEAFVRGWAASRAGRGLY